MPAFWIVKHLYVIEDILLCFFSSAVGLASDPFPFEELEEALGHGVIVAIPMPAHALLQVMLVQEIEPVTAAELAALIRMHHHSILGLPTPDGYQERIHRQVANVLRWTRNRPETKKAYAENSRKPLFFIGRPPVSRTRHQRIMSPLL